jgi:hypothetical protein
MFFSRAKLPVTEHDRHWVDSGFDRLAKLLGRERMLRAQVVVPTDKFFPDRYDASEASLHAMFARVCHYMKVDRANLTLEIFPDQTTELREIVPYFGGRSNDAAGVYAHHEGEQMVVAVKSSQMKDPLALVATLAHELCHVILLGGELMTRDEPDMEPMTDLATVFLGMGIFTANCAARFEQHQDERKIGWSTSRLGYLPEPVFGYSLAKFAQIRGEEKPDWAKHLFTNVAADFRNATKWLASRDSSRH